MTRVLISLDPGVIWAFTSLLVCSNICTDLLKCGAVSLVYQLPSFQPLIAKAVDTVPAPNCTFYVNQSINPLNDVENILDDDP